LGKVMLPLALIWWFGGGPCRYILTSDPPELTEDLWLKFNLLIPVLLLLPLSLRCDPLLSFVHGR
jgi:hypothetical protein